MLESFLRKLTGEFTFTLLRAPRTRMSPVFCFGLQWKELRVINYTWRS